MLCRARRPSGCLMEPVIGTALITAASGIGDIIRVTPLIRAVYYLGYEVDVLVMPDDLEAAELLRGAPEVRETLRIHSRAKGQSRMRLLLV